MMSSMEICSSAFEEKQVCHRQIFLGSPVKYLPMKADCMLSYRYNSFLVDMGIWYRNLIVP